MLQRLFRKKSPKQLLAEALGDAKLPAFPSATMSTLKLLRDPNSSPQEIAASIEANPGLVVHVLRMVNSAAYGLRQTVERTSHAIQLLGRAKIEALVVAVAARKGVAAAVPNGSDKRFWEAAALRASIARSVSSVLHPHTASEAFVGALLQDMALPLLVASKPRVYAPLIDRWQRDLEVSLHDLERRELGWDHTDVGACVAANWALPDRIVGAIGEHHHGEGEVLPAVHLVSFVRDSDPNHALDAIVETARASFGLAPDAMKRTVEEASGQARELSELLR